MSEDFKADLKEFCADSGVLPPWYEAELTKARKYRGRVVFQHANGKRTVYTYEDNFATEHEADQAAACIALKLLEE